MIQKIIQLNIINTQKTNNYIVGHFGVRAIEKAEYRVCGDPYPCFLVHYENGSTVEVRTIHICNIKQEQGE